MIAFGGFTKNCFYRLTQRTHYGILCPCFQRRGGRAWLNAHDSKSCIPSRVSGVRIPPSPPRAGVIQWQNRSFPCFLRGFDSPRPLHFIFSRFLLQFSSCRIGNCRKRHTGPMGILSVQESSTGKFPTAPMAQSRNLQISSILRSPLQEKQMDAHSPGASICIPQNNPISVIPLRPHKGRQGRRPSSPRPPPGASRSWKGSEGSEPHCRGQSTPECPCPETPRRLPWDRRQ